MEYPQINNTPTPATGALIPSHLVAPLSPLQQQIPSTGAPMDFNLLLGHTDPQTPKQLSAPTQAQLHQYGGAPASKEDNLPAYGETRVPSYQQQQQQQAHVMLPYPDVKSEQEPYARPSSGSHGSQPSPLPLYHLPQQQQQQQQQQQPSQQQQPQQHYAPSSAPRLQTQVQSNPITNPPRQLGTYPALETSVAPVVGRDSMQTLLEAYPSPQTESQRIVKMLEIMAAHMQEQYKRFDSFMSSVEERLGNVEAAVSQLALNDPDLAKRTETLSQRERMERERERDRELLYAGPPSASSPKTLRSDLKKKKKKKIVPEYSDQQALARSPFLEVAPRASAAGGDGVDEELARKLQAQFNAEAEIEALRKESLTLSDEEYAQRLQGLYLKRDAASGQGAKRSPGAATTTTASAAAATGKKDKPDTSAPKSDEKSPSLWSRLFGPGGSRTDSDDDSDSEDSNKDAKKTEVTTTYPASAAARAGSGASAAPLPTGAMPATAAQPMMAVPYYYPGMPQQPGPYVLGPQGLPPAYAPYPMAMQPGGPYLYPAPGQPAAAPQQ